jgi:hypothetical protein
MRSNIRWLHFRNGGRSPIKLLAFFLLLGLCVFLGDDMQHAHGDQKKRDKVLLIVCGAVALLLLVWYILAVSKTLTLALEDTPKGRWFGNFFGWGATFDYRMPRLGNFTENAAHMKTALLSTMLKRPVNQLLLGRWKGMKEKGGCCGCCKAPPPRLELYNDHIEMTIPGKFTGGSDTYCILLRDINAIHAGVGLKNIFLYLAVLCLVAIPIIWTIDDMKDDDRKAASIVCGVLFVILLVAWIFSKEATVCVGADPGGASHAMGNPFGASPFWVNFKTAGNDSVDSIIKQIRHQQAISASNQIGVVLVGHDLGDLGVIMAQPVGTPLQPVVAPTQPVDAKDMDFL